MNDTNTHYVFCAANDGVRLDSWLSAQMSISRSNAAHLISDGLVLCNSKPAKASLRLAQGDEISVIVPAAAPVEIAPENIPLDVVYEDTHVILVNKPKGMVVHPAAGHSGGTLVNALLFHCAGSLSGINGQLRPGIVHRIDKDTSGLLICAKNDAAHNHLAAQFAEHTVTREYRAIVCGGGLQDNGTIDTPIARHPIERKKMTAHPKGRRAVTHYSTLSRHGQYSHISAHLETGRTHQIRVHMSFIQRPVLGDEVYGNKKHPFETHGQVLHAYTLGFIHPATERRMEYSADVPDCFQKALARLSLT